MKKIVVLFTLIVGFAADSGMAQEFSLHVKLYVGADSQRTVIFGYDPSASDSMSEKGRWFPAEFIGGEQEVPVDGFNPLDFRMSGSLINRVSTPNVGDGGPIDIRRMPSPSNFILQYQIHMKVANPAAGARLVWDKSLIPQSIRHITLASGYFKNKPYLDMKNSSSLVISTADTIQLFENMVLTVYNNLDLGASSGKKALETTRVYPNPVDRNAAVHFNLPYSGDVSVQLYDVTGRKIDDQIISGVEGENSCHFISDHFQTLPGVYLLRIRNLSNGEVFEVNQSLIVR